MSFLYFPDLIKQKISNYSFQEQSVLVKSDMDYGTHTRLKGSETIVTLTFDMHLTNEEYAIFMNFIRLSKAQFFYMKFPDREYPNIDKDKYYCFILTNEEYKTTKLGNHGYKISGIVFDWHFMIEPIERA